MNTRLLINNIILALGIFFIAYYVVTGLVVTFHQSLLFLWPLAGAVCILRYVLVRRSLLTGLPVPLPGWFILAWRICLIVGFAFFAFVEFFIVRSSFEKAPGGLDAIVVLGARVNGRVPSGALGQRIDAAAEYLLENPDTVCVASGGQGYAEEITEAACIRDYLVAAGVAQERILLEEESVDTLSNLSNSLPLLPEGAKTVGVLTNDFHVFRSVHIARSLGGYEFYGVPARSTAWGYLHYAMREFCALVVGTLQGELHW